MDEVLEGVFWFRCLDQGCNICVPCGFIRCLYCGLTFSQDKVAIPPKPNPTRQQIFEIWWLGRSDIGGRWSDASDLRFFTELEAKGRNKRLDELRHRVANQGA